MDRSARGIQRSFLVVVATAAGVAHSPALADVDIDLIALDSVVTVGEAVSVEVVITSTTGSNKLVSAVQMIFSWDTEKLQLVGSSQAGAVNLLFSGFPADPYGINESNPPQDGLGLYQAWAPLGNPVAATPSGTLLTTLIFEALAPASLTAIDIVRSAGDPTGHTIVFDGTTPNTNITGEITGTAVTILSNCPADLSPPGGDGVVGVADLLALLAEWGECPSPGEDECPADLDGDGSVGVSDLLMLLAAWGPCP